VNKNEGSDRVNLNLPSNQNTIIDAVAKFQNIGPVKGKEIIQLYVKAPGVSAIMPEKELKGFAKVELLPGEEKVAEIASRRAFFATLNNIASR
jgi:beta-glucosidase